MKNYNEAMAKLNGRTSRKLQNNTYMRLENEVSIFIRLHETDIIAFHKNGDTVLTSGGWRTPTTKDRLNAYSPCRIHQDNGIWYVAGDTVFVDGMKISKNGKVTGAGSLKTQESKQKAVKKFVDAFIDKLVAGEIPIPSGADCWHCSMITDDGKSLGEAFNSDHIAEHVKESYFVPSMLMNAIKTYSVSPIANDWMIYQLRGGDNPLAQFAEIAVRQIKSSLRRYVKHEMAIAE